MKTIYPKQNNIGTCSAIILEKGDYKLPIDRFRGIHVDNIFIPEEEIELYDEEHMNQFISNISVAGIFYGLILTYKLYENERIISTNT